MDVVGVEASALYVGPIHPEEGQHPDNKYGKQETGQSIVHQKSVEHYNGIIMGAIGSQITSLVIVYSTVDSDADQRKHQSSTSLAFVRGIHRGPVNSPHKWPVTRKMFPFDDVIMDYLAWPLSLQKL